MTRTRTSQTPIKSSERQVDTTCFVIMPIADPDGYVKNHFKHVYQDIIRPACIQAGFSPFRADEAKQSNLIHLEILQKLLEAPMAVCDLSTRNPNVLFELAIRQAFDKPVALVQEVGTEKIFDISPLRYIEYRKERIYHEALEDQNAIATAIRDTFESHRTGHGINSIVKLLALSKPAAFPNIASPEEASAGMQQMILAELSHLKDEFRDFRRHAQAPTRRITYHESALESILDECKSALALLKETPSDRAKGIAQSVFEDCGRRYAKIHRSANMLSTEGTNRLAEVARALDNLYLGLKDCESNSE